MSDKEYLFTYRYDGHEWVTTVFASSPQEARNKIRSMSLARYDGEIAARVPAQLGFLAKLFVWVRNLIC